MNVRQIKKNMKTIDPLTHTLIGSIITTIGIITGKSELSNRKLFNNLKKNKQVLQQYDTVQKLADYIWTIYGNNLVTANRSLMVLVYDESGVRQPLVTLTSDEGTLMPLDRNGNFTGILLPAAEGGRDYIKVEYLYDENGLSYEEEVDE